MYGQFLANTTLDLGIAKSKVVAAVWGQFIFHIDHGSGPSIKQIQPNICAPSICLSPRDLHASFHELCCPYNLLLYVAMNIFTLHVE